VGPVGQALGVGGEKRRGPTCEHKTPGELGTGLCVGGKKQGERKGRKGSSTGGKKRGLSEKGDGKKNQVKMHKIRKGLAEK